MTKRKIGAILCGLASLIVIGSMIYKIWSGIVIGFNEICTIALLLSMLLSTITWGTKEDQDGILQDEELGRRITEKSSKVSYFLLTIFIFAAIVVDQLINGTINILLLILMALAIIILPLIEFLYIKKYE